MVVFLYGPKKCMFWCDLGGWAVCGGSRWWCSLSKYMSMIELKIVETRSWTVHHGCGDIYFPLPRILSIGKSKSRLAWGVGASAYRSGDLMPERLFMRTTAFYNGASLGLLVALMVPYSEFLLCHDILIYVCSMLWNSEGRLLQPTLQIYKWLHPLPHCL